MAVKLTTKVPREREREGGGGGGVDKGRVDRWVMKYGQVTTCHRWVYATCNCLEPDRLTGLLTDAAQLPAIQLWQPGFGKSRRFTTRLPHSRMAAQLQSTWLWSVPAP